MSKKKPRRLPAAASSFDQARDEMFSHILRCGVIEALPEHQKGWFDDTMQYLTDRYPDHPNPPPRTSARGVTRSGRPTVSFPCIRLSRHIQNKSIKVIFVLFR